LVHELGRAERARSAAAGALTARPRLQALGHIDEERVRCAGRAECRRFLGIYYFKHARPPDIESGCQMFVLPDAGVRIGAHSRSSHGATKPVLGCFSPPRYEDVAPEYGFS